MSELPSASSTVGARGRGVANAMRRNSQIASPGSIQPPPTSSEMSSPTVLILGHASRRALRFNNEPRPSNHSHPPYSSRICRSIASLGRTLRHRVARRRGTRLRHWLNVNVSTAAESGSGLSSLESSARFRASHASNRSCEAAGVHPSMLRRSRITSRGARYLILERFALRSDSWKSAQSSSGTTDFA
jgi:hypothetical protein